MSCLACSAALRDAAELIALAEASGAEDTAGLVLVAGMDPVRLQRVVLYLAAVVAGLSPTVAQHTGMTAVEVVTLIGNELTEGAQHEHGD